MDPRPEKPNHQHYLNEFRVEACPLFKQHQCQQHRPYTCFNWHFANQRRRRPVRKADGSFNYSPDIYCDKYDENTGICPDGDSCAYLHRVSGDVERKYHLRYYKTAQCVHPTDSRGQCVKNGAHCAFAHSSADLRQPQHDANDGVYAASLQDGESRDRTSFVIEDPQWHSQDHVLSCYKTEQCRKPARLCRQGYACPFYHNSKDRRRPPATFKYRSTPCPAAKTVDEWLDPELCEAGDLCGYCHTRTEQQFHPEIYKSTKCNDMLEHGYCPRAVFCAFAHHDSEMHIQRTPYASSSQTSPKEQHSPAQSVSDIMRFGSPGTNGLGGANFAQMQAMMAKSRVIPKQYSSREDLISSSYPKAPGFERGPLSPNRADNNMGRLRTHSLNMGHLDMASRQSMIGGTPLSLFEERPMASSFHQIPTLDELNLDLAPIEEQPSGRRETFSGVSSVGDVFGNAVSAPMRIPGSDSFHTSPMSYSESIFANKMNAAPFVPYQPPPSVSVPGDGAEEELARTRSELAQHHHKLAVWQDGIKQARQACEAWKADAEHYKLRAEKAEMERNVAIYERDQLRAQLATLQGGNGGNGNSGSSAAVSQPVPVGGEAAAAAAAVAASSPLYSTHPSSDFVESMMRAATLASSPPYQSLFGDDAPQQQPQNPACARCGRAGRPASDGGCSLCSV